MSKSSSPVESHGRVTAHSPNVQSDLSKKNQKRTKKTFFKYTYLFTFVLV